MSRKQVEQVILATLAKSLDARMAARGFARSPKSLRYSRHTDDGTQFVDLSFDSSPAHAPRGVLATLYPQFELRFPEVTRVALWLAGEDESLLAGAPDVVHRQQIDNLGSADLSREPWDLTSLEAAEIERVLRKVGDFVESNVFPVLDRLSTIQGFVEEHERGSERILWQPHSAVFAAAALRLLGRPEDGMRALEIRLGKAGPRRRYGTAFDRVMKA